MRVLHLITTMDLGGAEKHVATLALAQANVGMDVRIVYLSGDGEAAPPSVPSHRASVTTWRQIRTWLTPNSVLHAHLPRSEIWGAGLATGRVPLIISRHNAEPYFGNRTSGLTKGLSRAVSGRADSVIAISESVKRYHIATGHLASTARIEVVPYGYRAPEAGAAREFAWTDRRPSALRIACVARLNTQKDLPTLLRGVAVLRERGIDVDLRIAGEGPELYRLMALRNHLGISDHVAFIGKIPNAESFISGADLFALTSRYEGLGLVLLEAMAVGTPIVAARNTAIEEVVMDNSTGLLFETGDAEDFAISVTRLIEDTRLAAKLVRAAKVRLETEFGLDTMVHRIETVYRSALERYH